MAGNSFGHYQDSNGDWLPGSSLGTLISGEDQTNNVFRVEQQFGYETVAASQTDQILGTTGAAGDFLHAIIVDTATGTIVVEDGTTTVLTIPAGGTGRWEINAQATTYWAITTAASTSCMCVGRFT